MERAIICFTQAVEKDPGYALAHAGLAWVHIGLGEPDRALQLLEQAYERHEEWLMWLKVEWIFDLLHSDPRFQALRDKMKFPK